MPIEIVIDMDACPGCCGPDCGGVECRAKAGSSDATLCGFSEIASPSLPPRKYLRCDFSGGINGDQWFSNPTCGGPRNAFFTTTYTDFALYDPSAGCSLVDSGTLTITVNGGAPFTNPITAPVDGTTGCSYTVTKTQTGLSVISNNNPCCFASASTYEAVTGGVISTLSVEDTIYDAIDRAGFGSYGAWASCDATKYSFISVRGAGDFSSSFQQAEARVCCTGFIIGQAYEAILTTEQRLAGSSDPWVPGPGVTHGFTAEMVDDCVGLEIPMVDQMEVRVKKLNITFA